MPKKGLLKKIDNQNSLKTMPDQIITYTLTILVPTWPDLSSILLHEVL